MTYVPTVPTKVDVILVVGHRVLERSQSAVRLRGRIREAYPDHGQKGASGTESDLSWGNATGVLCDVQSLDKQIQSRKKHIMTFLCLRCRSHRRRRKARVRKSRTVTRVSAHHNNFDGPCWTLGRRWSRTVVPSPSCSRRSRFFHQFALGLFIPSSYFGTHCRHKPEFTAKRATPVNAVTFSPLLFFVARLFAFRWRFSLSSPIQTDRSPILRPSKYAPQIEFL